MLNDIKDSSESETENTFNNISTEDEPYFSGQGNMELSYAEKGETGLSDIEQLLAVTQENNQQLINKEKITKYKNAYMIAAACWFVICAVFIVMTIINRLPTQTDSFTTISDDFVPLAAFMWLEADTRPYTGNAPVWQSADGVRLPGFTDMTIPAGTADIELLLFNPVGNECNIAFEILLNDESLYKSGFIAPGMCVEEVTLTRELTLGEYRAVLRVSVCTTGEINDIGINNMEFRLSVKQ